MKIEQDIDFFILSTFRANPLKQGQKFPDKRDWFSEIAGLLGKRKFNNVAGTRTSYGRLFARNDLPATRGVYKNEVSINGFTILEVNNVHRTAILELFSSEDSWSHPYVLYLLEHLPRFKHMALTGASNEEKGLWSDMKIFCNMIPGMANVSDGRHKNVLTLASEDGFLDILKQSLIIVDRVVIYNELNDRVVCKDFGTVLLDKTVTSSDLKEHEAINSDVTLSYNIKELNELCRKLAVDIVL